MQRSLLIILPLLATAFAWAETMLPTEQGTTWKYQMTQEFGAGVRADDPAIKPDADGKWEYEGGGGGETVDEAYEIVAQESIEVPAGKFEAYHVRVIGTEPFHSVVDRWYVPGLGEIKDVTEVKRPNGSMLQRLTFELTEPPKLPGKSDAKIDK